MEIKIITEDKDNIILQNHSINIFYSLRLEYLLMLFKNIHVDNLYYMNELTGKTIGANNKIKIKSVDEIKELDGITIIEIFNTKDKHVFDKLNKISEKGKLTMIFIRTSIKNYLTKPVYFSWTRNTLTLMSNVFLVSMLRNGKLKITCKDPISSQHDRIVLEVRKYE